MKRILALALATILVSQLQAHAQTPTLPKPVAPTIEQLAAFPALSSLTVSPDGSRIAGLEMNQRPPPSMKAAATQSPTAVPNCAETNTATTGPTTQMISMLMRKKRHLLGLVVPLR